MATLHFENDRIFYMPSQYLGETNLPPDLVGKRAYIINDSVCSSCNPNKKMIPKGSVLEIDGVMQNFYGCFVEVKYDGYIYSLRPEVIRLVSNKTLTWYDQVLFDVEDYKQVAFDTEEESLKKFDIKPEKLFETHDLSYFFEYDFQNQSLEIHFGDSWEYAIVKLIKIGEVYKLDPLYQPRIVVNTEAGFVSIHHKYSINTEILLRILERFILISNTNKFHISIIEKGTSDGAMTLSGSGLK